MMLAAAMLTSCRPSHLIPTHRCLKLLTGPDRCDPIAHDKMLAVNVSAKRSTIHSDHSLVSHLLQAVKEGCQSSGDRRLPAVFVATKTDYFSEEGGNKTVFLKRTK